MKRFLLVSALGLATLSVTPAFAAGAFDFLDPCIKARSDFSEQRQQMREKFVAASASIDTMNYTPEFRAAWLKAKREQARPVFDEQVAPVLANYKVTDMDGAFGAWFDDMIASIAPSDLDALINTTFRTLAKEEVTQYGAQTEDEYTNAKNDLDGSCKSDVGNQVVRVALAPIGWIGGNFEAAKDEHNLVTQVFKAVSGVSPKDIAKHGILGGENSELRKLANVIAGGENSEVRKTLRFLDPSNTDGILGGSNSVFRKPFG
ncbi:hypothetical protein FHX10_006535 [Rhizobium sp. BK591]|uniref:hypothetical protein n=1 Tax=Rhizobium sp. BK591 TaxID=2586985 RepID=UPI00104B5594|nr:hypothetical protein [Rhizobium sp. BK591]MBB3746982.1 hypothetical protein [Rhizobium sp. BK591]